jgi:hypothetical protein
LTIWQICLEEENWVRSRVYLQDVNMIKKKKVWAQDDPSRRYHMLEAWCTYGCHEYLKICLKRVSTIVEYGGAIRKEFTKQVQSRKALHLELDKIAISKLKWNAQGKYLFLIGVLFYRSYDVNWETALSRGTLEWVIWSYHSDRSQTFASLASSFLIFIWILFILWFRSCGYFHDKL